MARKPRTRQAERPQISLLPAVPMTIGSVIAGVAVLLLGLFAIPRDGWAGLVWALPGIYVTVQPIQGFVRGTDDQLRLGWRRIDLSGLQQVTVHDRKNMGLKYSVASLQMTDHVEEITGMFLSTESFTRLVQWFNVPIKVVDGMWSSRQFWGVHPRLMPSRPPRQAKDSGTKKPRR